MLLNAWIDRSHPQYFISTEVGRHNYTWQQVSSGTNMVHQQRPLPNGSTEAIRSISYQPKLTEILIDDKWSTNSNTDTCQMGKNN